jgi:glycosyltransferase involved in cell wall biosynthesis
MTHPYFERAAKTPLDNLITLVSPLTNKLFVITGSDYDTPPCDVEVIAVKAKRRTSFVPRVLEQAIVHVRELQVLLNLRGELDVIIFFMGPPFFPTFLAFAQALNMKCLIILAGVGSPAELKAIKERKAPNQLGNTIIALVTNACERVSYRISDKLIVYSPSIIDQLKLHRYDKKIVITHRHFPNFDLFRFKSNIEQRDNVIGYVGRLSYEKGVLNFVKAIPKILSTRSDVTFLIIGEGPEEDEIRKHVESYAPYGKVRLTGWIPHQELSDCLVSMKLLVLPSYAEGLPNVMLEAMACGTPVLAPPVGSIPDVLTDGETGFLMYDNSPACIAETVIKTLENPHLKRIATNARTLVESEFRLEKLVETWGKIIYTMKGG